MNSLMQRGVPPQPRFLFFIKIAILVLSLLILALAAYSLSVFNGAVAVYGTGAGGFLIFVTIKSFIVFGGALAVEIWAAHLFFRLVALIAYSVSIIFWLSAWAYAASEASAWLSISDFDGYVDNYWKRVGSALAACAAFGAIVWILSIVHLVFFVRACMADPNGTSAPNQAELGQVKYQGQPNEQYGQPQYGQPQYGQPQQGQPQQGQPQYGQPQYGQAEPAYPAQ